MSAYDDFINSLSDEDKKILNSTESSSQLTSEKSQAELSVETIKGILDLQVASGRITESERGQILSDMNL